MSTPGRFVRSMLRGLLLSICAAAVGVSPPAASAQNFSDLKANIATVLENNAVPGVSVAIVVGDKIAWAEGIGLAEAGSKREVKADTLFQATALSKPVVALGVLRLVQDGVLELDTPVKKYVKSAQVPGQNVVTLRQLLSHTSGLSGEGFAGYEAGQPTPTLAKIFMGERPANSGPIVLEGTPGAKYKYSGGGYCVVQQVLIMTGKKPFPDTMQNVVLTPLAMKDSTYQQLLPAKLKSRAATAHNEAGKPVAGKWHVYPEMAAAGLWTTPSDLARFVIAVQGSFAGKPGAFLKQELARDMLKAQIENGPGLGLFVAGDDESGRFSFTGINHGFRCSLLATKKPGTAVIIMTNSDNGDKLYEPIQELVTGALTRNP